MNDLDRYAFAHLSGCILTHMALPDFRTDLQKNAEKELWKFGYRLRSLPTGPTSGYYKALTVGETADKIKRGVKRVLGG